MVYQKKKGIPRKLSEAAAKAGMLGGRSKSPKKIEAVKKNLKNVKHRERYTYNSKVFCVLGVLNPRKCLMPLEVLANPKAYRGRAFTVKEMLPDGEFKRHRVYFRYVDKRGKIEVDDKGMFHVWTWKDN